MTIQGAFRANLKIISKETALEFYKGVKSVILIPFSEDQKIRIEPDQHFSLIPTESVRDGSAVFIPSLYDEDGMIAYCYRKYINSWLEKD
jgi:hypothetical protein